MARKAKPPTGKTVEALRHEEATRRNIPTAEYQSVLEKEAQDPVRVAYERRNRDLDPQLVWRGKDEQDWSDLVVHAPPLYIQEKVHPKALIDDLLRQTRESRYDAGETTPDLFADFNGDKSRDAPNNLKPVGTGPYKFADFKPGDMVRGEINTNYHIANHPLCATLESTGGCDAVSAARAVIQTGEFDFSWNMQVEDEIL
ncbi:MAG: ABC transporter substrate-binding protein, partial [Dehalococcoidia bacterium]|nr:ABC transporter substrate-binding protein [Dehalococcoidia bacterium]